MEPVATTERTAARHGPQVTLQAGSRKFAAWTNDSASGQKALHGSGKKKGDRHLLCGAPFGPFRQKVPVTFSPGIMHGHLVLD
jgi:hypothetical protein